ncbi:oxygen-sensing cyclic-di-GMP phosphodiesterase DosP [Gibbsiella dentisursi]
MKMITLGIGEALIAALEQAFFACVLIDDNDRIRFFNQGAEKLWGFSREEVLGQSVERLVPPEIRADHGDNIRQNREGVAPTVVGKSQRLQLRRKDGQPLWASFTLLRLNIGLRPHYLALARDITEEVDQAQQLLLQFKVFHSAHQPMAILNADRCITQVNRAFAKLFGYEVGEMIGNEPANLFSAEELTPEEFANHQAFPWGQEPILHEAKARTKNGRSLWIRIFSSPIDDTDGPFRGYSLDVVHDITESRRLRDLERDVLQSMASDLSFSEQGKFLCRRLREIVPDILVSIIRVDDERRLRLWAADGLPTGYLHEIEGLILGPNVGSCGSAVSRGLPTICCDIEHDPHWKDYADRALQHGLRACWSFPIKLRNNVVAGALAFYSRTPNEPSAYHFRIVESCTHLCMLAIEREVDRMRMDRLTHFDRLTGLPNLERLRRCIDELLVKSSTTSLAVLSLGLDGFRDLNEGLGYAVGDRVLLKIATRLQVHLDSLAFVSRTEADIFVVVVPNQDVDSTIQLIKLLQEKLGEPFDAAGYPVHITASVGISLYPQDSRDRTALLEDAHKAMHEARALGRGNHYFFSPELNVLARDRFLLGTALHRAIAEGRLYLVYQPQVRLCDQQLYGVEALARWSDPELGTIPPERFIKLAEEIGEIEALGRWVLRQACSQMAVWQAQNAPIPVVSVNLSPLSFRAPGLADYVAALLQEYSLEGKSLTVEITESASMALTDDMLQIVRALRALGVGLAVDDFGTGYSSLSNLVHLPVTEVKIDRSFISQLREDERLKSIVVAVIGMGNSLRLNVIAEGVETAEQCDLLRHHQCPVIQGYFFSRPLAPPELHQWLKHRSDEVVRDGCQHSLEGDGGMVAPEKTS